MEKREKKGEKKGTGAKVSTFILGISGSSGEYKIRPYQNKDLFRPIYHVNLDSRMLYVGAILVIAPMVIGDSSP